MLDYSKVEQLLKKEFPSSTQDEIDYVISTLPANMPFKVVKAFVKMAKHLQDNPAKMKLFRSLTHNNVNQDTETE